MLAWVMNMGFAASDVGSPPVLISQLSTLILLGTCLGLWVTLG